MEKRGGALIDVDRDALEQRMKMYFDKSIRWSDLQNLQTGLTEDAARFEAKKAREKVLAAEEYRHERLRRYALRPYDLRWCYYSSTRPLWNEPRPSLWSQCWDGNEFLMARPARVADPEGKPIFFTRLLGDNDALRGHAYYFPLRLQSLFKKKGNAAQPSFFTVEQVVEQTSNLSSTACAYLTSVGISNPDADAETAALIWMHALAIGYAPEYLSENADGIRQDWPRVPLPASRERLLESAALGRQVAALLDTERGVAGVTTGALRQEMKVISAIARAGGGQIDPAAGDLEVTAGWGHAGKGGVTMPGKGKLVERDYTADERAAIVAGAVALGLDAADAFRHLGERTCDVYLNGAAYWRNVPTRAWEYTIGGYQVMKKWLSYRERELLGRALAVDEAREVRDMARRITALLLLEPNLDANYRVVKEAVYEWPQAGK
jgi:hypothetical protein